MLQSKFLQGINLKQKAVINFRAIAKWSKRNRYGQYKGTFDN